MKISTEPNTPNGVNQVLLEIRNLHVGYKTSKGGTLPVVIGANLRVNVGESIALVGESGCGKTTLALAALNLLPKLGEITEGSIYWQLKGGRRVSLLELNKSELREMRWSEASIVYQGAQNSLNPLTKISRQFRETLDAHESTMSRQEQSRWVRQLLEHVKLDPDRVLQSFPHQLSGGMKQRVMIAMALLLRPNLLILDEPTTALDILTQRSIVQVLQSLQDQMQFAMMFVTHDMALAAEMADRVAIMYAGEIVELSSVDTIFYEPRHPYTVGLLAAIPKLDRVAREIQSIPGSPPSPTANRVGCPFAPRCSYVQDVCRTTTPLSREISAEHLVSCHVADDVRMPESGEMPI